MQYLHTMLRVSDLDATLEFFCDHLGMREYNRRDVESGRFTLVFLCAADDWQQAQESKAPLLELTYNWPDQGAEPEALGGGRNFGHLAYRVDDIYATCQSMMDAGIPINRPPRDGHMAFVKTPDGISIELLQRGDALPPQEPWQSMSNSGSW